MSVRHGDHCCGSQCPNLSGGGRVHGLSLYNNEYGTTRHNSPGIQFNVGYNVARYLQVVGDFGAQFHNTNIVWTNGKKAEADSYQVLFGPEVKIRNRSRWTPFAHGLVGIAFRDYAVPTGNWFCTGFPPICYEDSWSVARESGFAWGVGGGLDWTNNPVISVRVFQFDWLRTKLSRDNPAFPPAQGQFPTLSAGKTITAFPSGSPSGSERREKRASGPIEAFQRDFVVRNRRSAPTCRTDFLTTRKLFAISVEGSL